MLLCVVCFYCPRLMREMNRLIFEPDVLEWAYENDVVALEICCGGGCGGGAWCG